MTIERPSPMTVIEEDGGTVVMRQTADYVPPRSWRTWLIGKPLATADTENQTIGKLVGLAVFASDALSSTAYATQEMLLVLAAAGIGAFYLSLPMVLAICGLLVILTLSYEQTIHTYPSGGGAYIVARDNLGILPAETAAAALLIDYVLTVAVSVSSGVAQITSAFTSLGPYRVEIAVGLVFFVMLVNLRGVREAGAAFAIPSYFFVGMMYFMVGVGLFRFFAGNLGQVVDPPPLESVAGVQALTLFLVLRAFSSGTTALTGVEAISNGIQAFREPRSRNAGITLMWMSLILGSLLLAITFLAQHISAIPNDTSETIISQVARSAFGGRNLLYLALIAATTLILIMAANTSFAGFPRLSAIAAADGFLPKQLTYKGSRLVYSRGIVALALIAALLIVVFKASVSGLIPLYAIGVFLSFTLSQVGMAHRWWKTGHLKPGEEKQEQGSKLTHDPQWRVKMVVNGFGAICTAVVTMVFAVTKFAEGAYIVVILMPIMVFIFSRIHAHYRDLAKALSLQHYDEHAPAPRHKVILAIGGVHRGTMLALHYALLLSDDVTAVHVSIEDEEAQRVRKKWDTWGEGVRLVILESPYRLLAEPLLQYIERVATQRQPNETITIVVPQFVPNRRWQNILHTQTALWLRLALMFRRNMVITNVPYHVEDLREPSGQQAQGESYA